jgi:hypothetical protein
MNIRLAYNEICMESVVQRCAPALENIAYGVSGPVWNSL